MGFVEFLRGVSAPGALLFILLIQVPVGIVFYRSRYRPYLGQILVTSTILTVALLFYLMTFSFQKVHGMGASRTTAATVPRLWVYLMIPSAVVVFMGIFKNKEKPDPPFGRVGLAGTLLLMLVVSIVLYRYIGFYISSALFLFSSMWVMKNRQPLTLILIPAGWVAMCYFLFVRLLWVPLPVGALFARWFY